MFARIVKLQLKSLILMLCAGMLLSVTGARASGHSITATVTLIDAKSGLMWLNLTDDKTLKIAASTKLLDDLKTGQLVEVVITKNTASDATTMPASDTSLAEVKKIEPEQGFLRLLTAQGEIVDLRPGKQLLEGLQAGDRVQIGIHPTPKTQ